MSGWRAPQHLQARLQRFSEQRLGIAVAALPRVKLSEIVEGCQSLGIAVTQRGALCLQHLHKQRLRVAVAGLVCVEHRQVAEARERLRGTIAEHASRHAQRLFGELRRPLAIITGLQRFEHTGVQRLPRLRGAACPHLRRGRAVGLRAPGDVTKDAGCRLHLAFRGEAQDFIAIGNHAVPLFDLLVQDCPLQAGGQHNSVVSGIGLNRPRAGGNLARHVVACFVHAFRQCGRR